MAWKLTDDSCMQHIRSLEGCKLWQLIEIGVAGEDRYNVYEDSINVDYYIKELRDVLTRILRGFGYDSIEHIINEYRGIFEAYQIIAECIFEYYGNFKGNILFNGTYEECVDFIKDYVKNTNIIWYRADYDNDTESEYFTANSDDEAIEIAKDMDSVDYADVGEVKRNLVELFEVDDNTEFFNEIRTVWY